MIKAILTVTKRPDMSDDAFRRYYHDVHGPIVGRSPGLRRYVQNPVRNDVDLANPYLRPLGEVSGVSELWFDDLDALRAAAISDAWRAAAEDLPKFTIPERTTVTVVDEAVVDLATATPAASAGDVATKVTSHGPVRVYAFASPGAGSVNAYWIETARSLVVVDGLRHLSHARAAVERMRVIGKPVAAVFVTHAHPDHFGGVRAVVEAFPDAPVYASAATAALVAADPRGYAALTSRVLGDDFDHWRRFTPLPDNGLLTIDGVAFRAIELGPGECDDSMTAIALDMAGVVFAADVVSNGFVPFLLDGHSRDWLAGIARFVDAVSRDVTAYPGHGSPGGVIALAAAQREMISLVRTAVGEQMARHGGWMPAARAAALAQLAPTFDGRPTPAEIPDLMGLNVDAVAMELTRYVSPARR